MQNCYTSLHPLRMARFCFTIEPTEEIRLPDYKGAALRGGFGFAFKKATCLSRDRQCGPCMLKSACAYFTVFETRVPKESAERLGIGSDAPHPFVLEPPMTERQYFHPGSTISYGLTLFGSAIDKLPFFVYAFMILGEDLGIGRGRGRFRLLSVVDDNGKHIYDEGNLSGGFLVLTARDVLESVGTDDRLISMRFQTPVRMKTAWQPGVGKGLLTAITKDEDFYLLLKLLYHRAFVLTQLYGDNPVQKVYNSRDLPCLSGEVKLAESRTHWLDWTRYSTRQKQEMQLGGMLGTVSFSGKTGQYLPLFKLGEYLHIGKGSTFGLGKYQLLEPSKPSEP
ncbi:MAG: CRISPR system precrRNA processing endoribonuclease RAMP protein Cas6 [Chlorobium sp.]|nr:MAG: CRISPR system precrRNA processing endoribonuclease RAMP protein Cas6 [Chlorobium sp.]